MKIYKPAVVFLFLLLIVNASLAVVINGGRGLPHTRAAWVQQKGYLTTLGHTRFWGKVHQYQADGIEKASTVWVVQGLVNVVYGLGDHFDLSVAPIIYQDVHQGNTEMYPGDTFVELKIGSFGPKANSISWGITLNSRFPTGDRYNVIYEPYSAGKVEFGFKGLVSYATDPLYPEEALNVHANLGYLNHNDVGQILVPNLDEGYPENTVLKTSQEMLYSVGLMFPTKDFNYSAEIYGNFWLQKPPGGAASREPYAYINASVTYNPYRWFSFIVGGDYRLTADKDETLIPWRMATNDLPNYCTWRVNIGAKFTLLPTSIYHSSERDVLMQKAESRRELFEQIIRERRETESAEEELERIRDERRKAERELERLRKILEGQEGQNELQEMKKSLGPEE